MWLLHTTDAGNGFSCGFGCKLFSRCFATCGLTALEGGGTEEIQERKVETAEPLHAQQHFSGLDLRKTTTEETE